MKTITLFLISIFIFTSSAFANFEDGKKKNKRKSNYDENYAPKIKTAPFSKGVGSEVSLELFIEGNHKMLVDRSSDNILFDHLHEGRDFIRVYTDDTDGNKALIVWQIKKVNKRSGDIKWKIYTYKKLPSLGWRPVDNRTTKVKSFK